jgi:L-lactate dehydrogenase complex protein LldE
MTQKIRSQVALMVTCLVDQVMPEVGAAATRLLRRAGFSVNFPPEQTCCGQPFYNSGFIDEAQRLAKHTIEVFEDQSLVVLPSGSCTTMIRKEYPHLFAGDPGWETRAQAMAAKTFELGEFLHSRSGLKVPEVTRSRQVTYHDSCHMCRMLGIKQQPRDLLGQAGVSISEMEEPDRCCGFGGLFTVRMPEVSQAMTRQKIAQARASGASLLVTSDPGCLMQIRALLDDDDSLKAEHIAVVLEEATR